MSTSWLKPVATGCITVVALSLSVSDPTAAAAQAWVCPPSASPHDTHSTASRILIAELSLVGPVRMPVRDQEQIVELVKRQAKGDAIDEVREEALELLKIEWQNRGYFAVQMTADMTMLASDPEKERTGLTVHVEEGPQYRLRDIKFKNNKVITSEALRAQFRITDGDTFRREVIAKGLENLRYAYGQLGYVNFSPVPDTVINEDDQTISLVVDIDEGKQFYVSAIHILGVDRRVLEDLILKRGQVYNVRLIEMFLSEHFPGVDVNDPKIVDRQFDEREGTVALTFDFRRCWVEE